MRRNYDSTRSYELIGRTFWSSESTEFGLPNETMSSFDKQKPKKGRDDPSGRHEPLEPSRGTGMGYEKTIAQASFLYPTMTTGDESMHG